MILSTRTQGVALSDELATHIERQVRFALASFAGRITRIRVRLEDGSDKGGDKQCKIRVGLRSRGSLVVKEHDADAFAAIARATDRLGHAVASHLERVRIHPNRRKPQVARDAS